jgi:hypothetical protein
MVEPNRVREMLGTRLPFAENDAISGHRVNLSGASVQLDFGWTIAIAYCTAVTFHLARV